MITSATNDNHYLDPIYIYIKLFGPVQAAFGVVSVDMHQVGAKWLSFAPGDGRDIIGNGAWAIMERPDAFLFTIKHAPHILSTLTGKEMDLLVPRIRTETEMVLSTLAKIAISKDLGYIDDIEEFLYIVETMNLVKIVTGYVSTAYFV